MTDPLSPPPAPPPATPKPRRVWRWLLVVSLALNLLFLGLAAGGAVRMWRSAPQIEAQSVSGLMLLWRALPDDERRSLRSRDRDGEGSVREGRESWRARVVAEVSELRRLLTAEPFDRAALEARLRAARDLQAERAETAFERMLDRIEAMGPTQRAAMAERLERRYLRRSARD